jgi:hypothetical protein
MCSNLVLESDPPDLRTCNAGKGNERARYLRSIANGYTRCAPGSKRNLNEEARMVLPVVALHRVPVRDVHETIGNDGSLRLFADHKAKVKDGSGVELAL